MNPACTSRKISPIIAFRKYHGLRYCHFIDRVNYLYMLRMATDQLPQLIHEHEPQHDVLPDELDPLVAPVSESIMDSDTSITSIESISFNKLEISIIASTANIACPILFHPFLFQIF